MKALDTPILLELLRGRSGAKRILKRLQGAELATTELNLFELEVISKDEGGRSTERRRAALERLRRKLTVLPIDERAVRSAMARTGGRGDRSPATLSLMLGAAEANGCTEWVTTSAGRPSRGSAKLTVEAIVV